MARALCLLVMPKLQLSGINAPRGTAERPRALSHENATIQNPLMTREGILALLYEKSSKKHLKRALTLLEVGLLLLHRSYGGHRVALFL